MSVRMTGKLSEANPWIEFAEHAKNFKELRHSFGDPLGPARSSTTLNIGDDCFRPSEKIGINDHA